MKRLAEIRRLFVPPVTESADTTIADKIFIVLLVLCPLLQHYNCLSQDASTVLLVGMFPYFALKLLRKKMWNCTVILPLIAFSLYEIVNHGTGVMEIARETLLLGYFLAAASDCIDLKFFVKTAINIALLASGLLVVQYICYYVLGFHLQFVPTSLLSEKASQWILLARTGTISVTGKPTGFYRPSAFFLEPSHLTIMCFPALVYCLLCPMRKRPNYAIAVMLSMGMVLSTSGMGIALVVGIWGLFILGCVTGEGSLRDKISNLVKPRSLMIMGAVVLMLLILYAAVPPFRMSINRIFIGANGGNNAIQGRMGTGIKVVMSLSGWEVLFGKLDWGDVHRWNMSGVFYVLYTQGAIGMILSYAFYVRSLFKTGRPHFWIAALIMGLSLVTIHTHAAFFMLYYVMILLEGYQAEKSGCMMKNVFYDFMLRIDNRCRGVLERLKK